MTEPDTQTLSRSARLTAAALWRESVEAEPRAVTVTLGQRTLMFIDAADRPVGHWARSGIRAVAAVGVATRYAILADAEETLEIRDPAMKAALDAGTRTHPGVALDPVPAAGRRVPWGVLLGLVLATALLAEVPGLIQRQAARMVPPAQARDFGERMLDALSADQGPVCATPAGARALDIFAAAAAPGARLRVRDLRGAALAVALPGPLVLIDGGALERASGPTELAGWIAQALGPSPGAGQVRALMGAVGPLADLRYVFTGTLSEASLARASAAALAPPARPDSIPAAGEAAAFSAEDWRALRAICDPG
jgi:hypothetical protein